MAVIQIHTYSPSAPEPSSRCFATHVREQHFYAALCPEERRAEQSADVSRGYSAGNSGGDWSRSSQHFDVLYTLYMVI
ncbi:hypothetical protein NQZ68_000217 [Dissostichus eleginoides]|nr:hypothetical protein NQZ68_000217 [Dissostichus eleginoides]